jgi:hypothetical protein
MVVMEFGSAPGLENEREGIVLKRVQYEIKSKKFKSSSVTEILNVVRFVWE